MHPQGARAEPGWGASSGRQSTQRLTAGWQPCPAHGNGIDTKRCCFWGPVRAKLGPMSHAAGASLERSTACWDMSGQRWLHPWLKISLESWVRLQGPVQSMGLGTAAGGGSLRTMWQGCNLVFHMALPFAPHMSVAGAVADWPGALGSAAGASLGRSAACWVMGGQE